jgi:hypothetical protein
MTAVKCYICKEDSPCEGKYVATFDGKQWRICDDCAMGIRDGLDVLKKFGVARMIEEREKE